MKQLREQIRKEIKTLMEKEMKYYSTPPEIINACVNDLKLRPLVRYVATFKAANTVPASYRVFFHNNQYIDLYLEEIGVRAEIKHKHFWLNDIREVNAAIALLNHEVLTAPIPVSSGEGEEGGEGGEGGEEGETMEPETDEPEEEA